MVAGLSGTDGEQRSRVKLTGFHVDFSATNCYHATRTTAVLAGHAAWLDSTVFDDAHNETNEMKMWKPSYHNILELSMQKHTMSTGRTPFNVRGVLGWMYGLIVLSAVFVCAVPSAIGQQSTPEPQMKENAAQRDAEDIRPERVRPRRNGTEDSTRPEKGAYDDDSEAVEQTGDLASGPALPAYRIIDILRQQPDMLARAKDMAEKLQRSSESRTRPFTGDIVDTDNSSAISDDALFGLIDERQSLRLSLTRELKAKGLLTVADYAKLGQVAPKASSRKSEQPETGRTRRAPASEDQNQPDVSRRWSPYEDLPSLRDLYAQFPNQRIPLRRFGGDVFQSGTGNLDGLPADVPVGPDYVLGTGDTVTINMWGGVVRKFSAVVDPSGRIVLPEAGSVMVAGQTLAQSQQLIERALSHQFRKVNLEISLARVRTLRVYVVGDVERPGAYDVSSLSSVLSALYAAGGPTSRGSLRQVRQYRGQQLLRELDLYDFLLHGIRSDVERLQSGDTILVPPAGPQVTVSGVVRRPAIYELNKETELADVLEMAGGVLVSATLRHIDVERIEAHERRVMASLDLPQGGETESLRKSLGTFHVQDGDRINISPILPYSEQAVYLQGHVFRPGKYPFKKGLSVGGLVRSYQDLLPEPADHAEIVRLSPPDYRPTVIDFNLAEVLSNDDPVELQAFDTVRIFGRYEIDAPRVSIFGEVLRPGEYPLSHTMTASALVRLAGGFKRSALTQTADLASYVVQDGEKVLTKHTSVDISKALSGETNADPMLKPGDVLTVRQMAGWENIGAAVTLKGEVKYAGTYGIREGEKLSAVLKRAGGFGEGAYAPGAILERVQVRDLAERNRAQLMHRIEAESSSFKPGSATGQEQTAMLQVMQQQRDQVLGALRNQSASGRLVIKISADISSWENTPADIEMRKGDVLTVPRRPDFVLVNGQVYNSSAITYVGGKSAGWYLSQAGGPTDLANKNAIFVVRANGSVLAQGGNNWWKGNILSVRLEPGDSIVVPDKVVGGSSFWKNLMTSAQLMSSVALTAGVLSNF